MKKHRTSHLTKANIHLPFNGPECYPKSLSYIPVGLTNVNHVPVVASLHW